MPLCWEEKTLLGRREVAGLIGKSGELESVKVDGYVGVGEVDLDKCGPGGFVEWVSNTDLIKMGLQGELHLDHIGLHKNQKYTPHQIIWSKDLMRRGQEMKQVIK